MKDATIILTIVLCLIFWWIGYFCGAVEPAIVTETIEVVKEVPVELRNFKSETELKNWLAHRDRTIRFTGVADFESYNCVDYSLDMVEQAREDGYDIYPQWTDKHWLCMTVISDSIYFVEPQNDTFWEVWRLD